MKLFSSPLIEFQGLTNPLCKCPVYKHFPLWVVMLSLEPTEMKDWFLGHVLPEELSSYKRKAECVLGTPRFLPIRVAFTDVGVNVVKLHQN